MPANEQRAEQDAAAILAAFAAPPGAQRLKAAPGTSGGVLTTPDQMPATPDLADDVGWWQVAGSSPQQVLGWVSGHLPHGFAKGGAGTESRGNGTGTTWDATFELSPVPGVLSSRQLIVEAVGAGGGQTDIRVDAAVIWLPARAPGETIPAGTTAVTLAVQTYVDPHVNPPHPATVTDPAKIRQLTALINGLPAFPRGMYACPADGGAQLVLTFSAVGGRVLAVAAVDLQGCQGVGLTVTGRPPVALGLLDGGPQTAAEALKIAGLNWKLPA